MISIPFWLLQIDVDAPGPSATPGQVWLGWIMLAVIAAIVVAVRYRNRYVGLEGDERKAKAKLAGSKRDQSPKVIRIPRSQDPESYRDDVEALFDPSIRSIEEDRVTGVEALQSVRGAFRETWRPVTQRFSSFVLRLVSLSWLLTLLGAVAVATDAVVRLILVDTSIGSPDVVLRRAIELTFDVLAAGSDVLLTFPYIGDVWSLAFAFLTLGFEFLYREWYLVPIALLLAAIAIHRLENEVSDELETKLLEDRRSVIATWVGSTFMVWSAGVVPTALGSTVGAPEIGAIVGFVLALTAAIALGSVGLYLYIQRLRSTAFLARDESRIVMSYLVARRAGISAAVPGSILLVSYAAVIVAEGKVGQIIDAFIAADLGIKALVLAVIVSIVGGFAWQVRSAWPDVRASLAESFSRTQVRAAVFYRGSIAIGFAAGYLLAFAFTRDVLLGLVLAAIGAVLAFGVYHLLERAKYKLSVLESEEAPPKAVTIQGWRLKDHVDERHPYAMLNGRYDLAREDVDELVDEILEATASIQSGGRPDPTLGTYHAESLLELGQTDEQLTRDRVKERARKLILDELRPVGHPVDRDDVEDVSRDVPEVSLRYWLDRLVGNEIADHGETLELVRDPWSGKGENRSRGL